MKKYSDYIFEVKRIDDLHKGDVNLTTKNVAKVEKTPGRFGDDVNHEFVRKPKHVSSIVSHNGETHHIYAASYPSKEDSPYGYKHVYHVTNDKGETQLEIHGGAIHHENKMVGFKIGGLYSNGKPSIRTSDVYKHLMKHHNLSLVSDSQQTHAGSKVWERLRKDPEVQTHLIKKVQGRYKPNKTTPTITDREGSKWAVKSATKPFLHRNEYSRIVAHIKRN